LPTGRNERLASAGFSVTLYCRIRLISMSNLENRKDRLDIQALWIDHPDVWRRS